MKERVTRKELIDPRLREAGWTVTFYFQGSPLSEYNRCAIEEYPTETGPADYALCLDGRVVGIVEVKKLTLGSQNDLTQASRCACGLTESEFDFRGYRVPFLYSTNGEVIWFQDIRHNPNRSRQISGFHTPEALADKLGRAVHAEDLSDDRRELFQLAADAGYVADLKDFFRWLKAKRNQLVHDDEKIPRQPDEELLALVPDLTPDEIKVILLKFKGDVVKRIAKLTPEQTEAFNEEVAKLLYYLELEAKVKKSGELTGSDL